MTSAFMDDERDDRGESEPTDLSRSYTADLGNGYTGLASRTAWRFAFVLFLVTAVAILLQILTGLFGLAVRSEAVIAVLAMAALSLSALFWILGNRDTDARWLHLAVLASYALLAIVLNQMPALEAHLGIVYLEPLVFVALFLPSRSLPFFIALSVVFIAYSTFNRAGEDAGIAPGVLTSAALVSVASMTLYVRLQLDRVGRQAAFLSGRDALTGLANLRPLYERLEQMTQTAERGEKDVTVLMLDLEGFKKVNDHYSHSTGDQTLREVADALVATVRRDELVARRGGDEFAVVTDAGDPDEIEAMIQRITDAVSERRFELLPDMPTGITAGSATFREGDTVGKLLARADRSLHEAKAAAQIERWSWRSELGPPNDLNRDSGRDD
ncbi:MAG: GGDEF domain-containing protein [Solirubrobacterales bacterium]